MQLLNLPTNPRIQFQTMVPACDQDEVHTTSISTFDSLETFLIFTDNIYNVLYNKMHLTEVQAWGNTRSWSGMDGAPDTAFYSY